MAFVGCGLELTDTILVLFSRFCRSRLLPIQEGGLYQTDELHLAQQEELKE